MDNIDKTDIQTALTTLYQIPAGDELLFLIKQNTSDWIIHILDDYSDEYHVLHKNWITYCEMLKTTPQRIVIVSDIETYEEDQKEFTPIQQACDILTMKGYCIRRISEFTSCEGGCNKAVASKELHHKLKNHPIMGKHVRGRWSPTCKACS